MMYTVFYFLIIFLALVHWFHAKINFNKLSHEKFLTIKKNILHRKCCKFRALVSTFVYAVNAQLHCGLDDMAHSMTIKQ